MKLAWMPALVLGCALIIGGSSAATAQSSSGTLAAVMDMQKVLDKHPQLQAKLKSIQDEYKAFQQQTIETQKRLRQQVQQLKELKPNSPERKRLEGELAQKDSSMAVDVRLKQKEFLTREAQAHYQAYVDVMAAVERVATRHSIGMVLRYDSKKIDPDQGQSILRGISRNVIYQRQLDITDLVVQELHSTARQPAAGNPNYGGARR